MNTPYTELSLDELKVRRLQNVQSIAYIEQQIADIKALKKHSAEHVERLRVLIRSKHTHNAKLARLNALIKQRNMVNCIPIQFINTAAKQICPEEIWEQIELRAKELHAEWKQKYGKAEEQPTPDEANTQKEVQGGAR